MSDLEKLNAEIERLEEQVADLDNRLSRYALDDWRMKERIKLLTKAGDYLEEVLTAKILSYEATYASHQWRAAKDGKDAQ
jgi:hypothetical protein